MKPVELVLLALPLTDGIDEVPSNRGRAVALMQRVTGGSPGDPWCADYVAYVGSTVLGARWPLRLTGSCDELLADARMKGLVRETPQPGDLFLVMKSATDAVHTGFVTSVFGPALRDGFRTAEGNTNDGGGREGTGTYRRTRGTVADTARYVFVRWADAPSVYGVTL